MKAPLVLAAAAMLLSMQSNAPLAAQEHAAKVGGQTTHSAIMLRQDMRKLWTDHVVWTCDYIVAATSDHPSAQAAATRLLKNQEDIGNAVAVYYGKDAGGKLTGLLKEHITIAVDLIKAAKAGDKAGQGKADAKWQQNDLMKMHLSTTTNEVVARLNKSWDADVRAFDEAYNHILKMSDALSEGIIKQYPDKFRS